MQFHSHGNYCFVRGVHNKIESKMLTGNRGKQSLSLGGLLWWGHSCSHLMTLSSSSSTHGSVSLSLFPPEWANSISSLIAHNIPPSHPACCQPTVQGFSLLFLYCPVSLPCSFGYFCAILCTFTRKSWPSSLSISRELTLVSAVHAFHRGPDCPVLGQTPKLPSCLSLPELCHLPWSHDMGHLLHFAIYTIAW